MTTDKQPAGQADSWSLTGHAVRPSAVAWIDSHQAMVARVDDAGQLSTCTITRGREPEPSYLALVVGAIGDREVVAILGPSSLRLALEREYVAIYHRPERLVDLEPAGPVDESNLVDRVRELAAAGDALGHSAMQLGR